MESADACNGEKKNREEKEEVCFFISAFKTAEEMIRKKKTDIVDHVEDGHMRVKMPTLPIIEREHSQNLEGGQF